MYLQTKRGWANITPPIFIAAVLLLFGVAAAGILLSWPAFVAVAVIATTVTFTGAALLL